MAMRVDSQRAYAYAKAIFVLALEQKNPAAWSGALRILEKIEKMPQVQQVYKAQNLSLAVRVKFLRTLCDALAASASGDGLPSALDNFLSLLLTRKRFALVARIYHIYQDMYDEYAKILRVKIVSAKSLTDDIQHKLLDTVTQRTGYTIKMTTAIDEKLIAGAILYLKDKVIDSSVRGVFQRLDNLF